MTEGTYWGTPVADMQSNIEVADGNITGTLKYLSEGQLATDWGAGHFIALKFTTDLTPTNVKVGLDPSQGSGLVTLDSDEDGVFKVTNKDLQNFVVQYTDGTHTYRDVYDLSKLVLE